MNSPSLSPLEQAVFAAAFGAEFSRALAIEHSQHQARMAETSSRHINGSV